MSIDRLVSIRDLEILLRLLIVGQRRFTEMGLVVSRVARRKGGVR